jgi:Uma2 family endonuclease
MSTAYRRKAKPPSESVPLLVNGDRMTQPEFHRRYQAYPEDEKFELIGGIVYLASPLRRSHGNRHPQLSLALALYGAKTPGLEVLDNTTTILGEESEPQPDLALRILREFGGRSKEDEDDYIVGPPELVAEVAYSSRAIDLHQKKDDYQQAGVLEYIVLCVEERELYWFHFRSRRSLHPNDQGITCSRVFPGLWIDGQAVLALNSARIIKVAEAGLASPEHAAFIKRLEAAQRKG